MPDSVVGNWGLVEGEDYSVERPDDGPEAPRYPRPADDTSRSDWVAYVVARGTDPEDAGQMQLDELMELYPEAADEPRDADAVERPAASAKKAEWVEYVVAAGGDESWARGDDTTKADLQEWEPGSAHTAPDPHTTDQVADQGNATVGQ